MSVKCPYCGHGMRVKGAHAGRFLPACDRCGDTFMLVVPPDPDAEMMVTALDGERRKLKKKRKHGG